MNSPCHGCTERTIHCHGNCEHYKLWRKKLDDANAQKARPEETPEFTKRLKQYMWKKMRWR